MASKDPISQTLLSLAHSPTSTSRILSEKILRPLHLKPTSAPNPQIHRRRERERKLATRKKKLKPRPLSSRQKRALCLYDIPKESRKYGIYVGLNEMWVGYIREILGIDGQGNGEDGREREIGMGDAAKLCAADYHGAEVEVVRSRCVSRVGVKGIVVKDSKFVFEIITPGNQVKVVPKEHTVFRFRIARQGKDGEEKVGEGKVDGEDGKEKGEGGGKKDLVFELHGDQFIVRAADRANRKFKSHFLPDI